MDVAVAVLGAAGLEVVVADRAEEVAAAAAAPVLARADDELGDTKMLSIIGRLGDVYFRLTNSLSGMKKGNHHIDMRRQHRHSAHVDINKISQESELLLSVILRALH